MTHRWPIIALLSFALLACGEAPRVASSEPSARDMSLAYATWPAFDHALCTCANLTGNAALTISGHDSNRDAPAPAGAVGIGGVLQHGSGALQTSGPLYISGSSGSRTSALQVGGDLFVQGPLTSSSSVAVAGDAWLGGNTSIGGSMQVHGATTLASNARLQVAQGHAPTTRTQDFHVQAPCDCESDASVLILNRIQSAARVNDNAAANFSADALRAGQHTVRLMLPAGSYYLSAINTADPVTLVAEGDVDLHIAGDVAAASDLHIVSARGGRLDVYVAGSVSTGAKFFFGNARVPGHARLYVAGKHLHTGGVLNVAGNIYAPHADVLLSTASRLRGSAWFNSLAHNAPLNIVYDPVVTQDW